MNSLVLYRPAAGRRVLCPNGAPLPAAGAPIVLTPYWRRLLAAGDIEAVSTKSTPKPRSQANSGSDEGSKSA